MLDLLEAVLIAPLRWALLNVLQLGFELTGSQGAALLFLSLAFNLLLVPAYHWAELLQARERAAQQRMKAKKEEFAAVFSGQILHLMLRQLYRLHGYHPVYALRSLAPLAIQLPFFIAAFGLLSHHAPFRAAPFLFIRDLSQPDGLLAGINVLPLLMTAANLLALHLHARQLSRSDWLQGLAVALVFLVLLYHSPSGLALYWLFNNLVSVAKSAWYARGRAAPGQGHALTLLREIGASLGPGRTQRLLQSLGQGLGRSYALACALAFMLLGIALPIGFTSLEDNVDGLAGYPGFFLAAGGVAAALFVIPCWLWYRLCGPALRAWSTYALFALVLLALAFAFTPQPDAGMLDNFVFFTPKALVPGLGSALFDATLIIGMVPLAFWFVVRHGEAMRALLAVLLASSVLATGISLSVLSGRIDAQAAAALPSGTKLFHFARTERNVLLVFLDGAMSGYLPAILEAEPQLREQLRGFRWYPNVISAGNRTINGLPSVFGGVDYTVGGINARRDGTLQQKVTDAYKVFVDNFQSQGYQVQYADPFWFGLVRTGDCELFNAMYAATGTARCIHSIGKGVEARKLALTRERSRDFFVGLARQYLALTLFRTAPHSLKNAVYDEGRWLSLSFAWKKRMDKFLNNHLSFSAMPELSSIDARRPTFNFLTNEAPRATFLLDEDCLPADPAGPPLTSPPRRFQDLETEKIYQTHRCVLRSVGQFLDWMRTERILDNSYVVFASDHGWVSENPLLDGVPDGKTYSMFQAFLMVKPFDSQEALIEDPTRIANFHVPGLICDTIGGCIDRASGKTIRYEALAGPVRLYETPWQPAGQTLHDYVIEALHENDGPVGKAGSWRRVKAGP